MKRHEDIRQPSYVPPGGQAKPLAERTLAEVRWALARRSFASADELNAYLERAMAGEEKLLRPEELTPEEKAQVLVYDALHAGQGRAAQVPVAARRKKRGHFAL